MSDNATDLDIQRLAQARTKAAIYSLDNPYLTLEEKTRVEAVYQFPLGVFILAFAYCALALDQSFWSAYGYATLLGMAAWLLCWAKPDIKVFLWAAFIHAGWIGTIIDLAIAGYALYERRWGVAVFVGLEAFGLMALLIPPMWAWSLFGGRRLNPKYTIAKKLFGTVFPFERDLD